MFLRVALCLVSLAIYNVSGQAVCTDLRGRQIAHGLHYVPGPDTCTLCVCDNGLPKVCKAVLCSPPQDCRSFRVGATCCDFICLDDVVKPAEGSETNFRVAATGAALVVILTVALIVYRVKRQKITRATHTEDQRSLTSIGYISGSMGYMGGTSETALGAWKPPGHYLPRGEAPPPYDEAMAQSRENRALEQYPRPAVPTADQFYAAHYANLPRAQQQMANPQTCFTAPLLQPMPSDSQLPIMTQHPLAANLVGGFPRACGVRLTGSLGAISGRALSVTRDHPAPLQLPLPPYYARSPALHRTIPRITPLETTLLDAPLMFSRADRSSVEVRRSFHRPAERLDTGRSMPRHLNLAADTTEPLPRQIVAQTRSNPDPAPQPPKAHSSKTLSDTPKHCQARTSQLTATRTLSDPSAAKPNHSTLPLTVDKPSCVCSYSEVGAAGADDTDDYRNECENCKATNSSRWVREEPWRSEEETQSLQRRAPNAAPPPPAAAAATLPQRSAKPRPVQGQPSNWDHWYTIPDTDTESDGE